MTDDLVRDLRAMGYIACVKAADEIERLQTERDELFANNGDAANEIGRLQAALRGLLDEVMCFSIDPPSAALNHAIEEAGRALEDKP